MYEINGITRLYNIWNEYTNSWQYQGNSKDYSLDTIVSLYESNSPKADNNDFDIDTIFEEKIKFSRLSTLQALSLITERELLRDKNVNSIDSRIMYCQDSLSRLNMLKLPATYSRKIDGLQRSLFDLERQRRDEAVSSWKDTLVLKLSILEKLKDYQNLKRQGSLLKDER